MNIVSGDLVLLRYYKFKYPSEYGIVVNEPRRIKQVGPVVSILVGGLIKKVHAKNFQKVISCGYPVWKVSDIVR